MTDLLLSHVQPTTYFFDFWSLDVEGAELEVLQSLDWDTFSFGVLLIEANGKSARKELAIRTFLEKQQGYAFLGEEHHSAWFVHPRFAEIYADVLYTN